MQTFLQHDAEPAGPAHAPLVQVVATAEVQPLAPTVQVERLVLDAQVAPTVQAFVQHDAEPAAPEHAPLVQLVVDEG